MIGADEIVSRIDGWITAEALRRIAATRPHVSAVLAESLASDEAEWSTLSAMLSPEDCRFGIDVLTEVYREVSDAHAGKEMQSA